MTGMVRDIELLCNHTCNHRRRPDSAVEPVCNRAAFDNIGECSELRKAKQRWSAGAKTF